MSSIKKRLICLFQVQENHWPNKKKRFVNDEMVVMFLYLYIKLFIFISQYEYHSFYVFPNKLFMREVSVRVLAPNPSVVDPLSKPECLEPLLLVVSIPEEAEDSEL